MPRRIIIRRKQRRRRRRPRRFRRTRRPMKRRVRRMRRSGIPAALSKGFRASYSIKRISGGVLVTGRDLIYSLPEAVAAYDSYYLFAAITANPCYWTGTRIAAIAAAHQNYRPLVFRASYVPQVAVTQAGTVMTGTNWHTLTNTGNFQQAMVTSNGGALSQCYVPFDTSVKLGTNLQQNLYNCSGPLDVDHNPFNFLAFMRGSNVIPGYFYVSYSYVFKNPVGASVTYTSRRTRAPDYGLPTPDKSIMLLGPIANFSGPGLTLDVESNGTVLYNGSEIAIPDGTNIMVYDSVQAGGISTHETARSILVTDTLLNIGDSYDGVSDYSVWDWENDATYSQGKFRPTASGGSYGFGWYLNEATSRLYGWADAVVGASNLIYYAVDTYTRFVTALLVMQKAIQGTRSSPSVIFEVEPYRMRRGPLVTKHEVVKMLKEVGSRVLRTSAEADHNGASKKTKSATEFMTDGEEFATADSLFY